MSRARFLASVAFVALGCSSTSRTRSDAGKDGNSSPGMSALTVTSPSNASLALVPSFSPSVYNYYVLCGPGSNALEVSFTAGSGELGALVIARQGSLPKSPESSAWTASQTTSLNVEENAAVVAFATNASKSTTIEYWVRCLPDDFPDIQMSPNPSAGTPPDGYYLLGNRTLNGTPAPGGYAMVLDIRGVPVWYLRMPSGQGVINVDDVVPGAITLLESNLNQYEVHFLDPLHTTIAAPPNSSLVTSPNLEDQHELRYLPNGNFMVISNPSIAVDMSGVTTTEGSSIALGPNTYIRACDVIEFNPNKGNEIIWQWKGALHIDAQKESTIADYSGIPAPAGAYVPYVVDALHCNSIDLDPEGNGNLLMSARNMDAVWYVENPGGASPTAGKILWKLGGKKYSQDNATLLTAADPFYRQHDARFVSWNADCDSGTGQISVFDDESDEPNPARGVIYDVVVGGGSSAGCKPIGAAPGTAVVAWQYKGVVASYGTGSFRSTNLGRVIGWGFGGEQKLVFTEVDESGNDLLDFYFNDDNSSYRTVKVPLSEFPLDVLRQTAGGNETTFP